MIWSSQNSSRLDKNTAVLFLRQVFTNGTIHYKQQQGLTDWHWSVMDFTIVLQVRDLPDKARAAVTAECESSPHTLHTHTQPVTVNMKGHKCCPGLSITHPSVGQWVKPSRRRIQKYFYILENTRIWFVVQGQFKKSKSVTYESGTQLEAEVTKN